MTETNFRVDFSDVETKNFDPVPAGRYLFAVTDYEVKECGPNSKNPGAPLIQHEFTLQEPYEIKDFGKVAERKVWTNFMPTIPTTLFRLKNFLEALGDDVSGELNYDPIEICSRPLERRLLVAKLSVKPARKDAQSGKTYDERNDIKSFYHAVTWKGAGADSTGAATGSKSLLP